jgi:hypothetical protein
LLKVHELAAELRDRQAKVAAIAELILHSLKSAPSVSDMTCSVSKIDD